MAMGTPASVYNGGLLQAHMRYFGPSQRRSGLPRHVAAMVDRVGANSARVTLVNTDPVLGRTVLLQAGSFGEHEFTQVSGDDGNGEVQRVAVDGKNLLVKLGPAGQIEIDLGMKRFVHQPSYDFPVIDGWTTGYEDRRSAGS